MSAGQKRFEGRAVALMGCATGLGRSMAVRFAQEGASLALADVDAVRLGDLVEELTSSGSRVTMARVDVRSAEDVERFASQARAHFGAIHLFCSNAGVNECPAPAWELTPADWDWVFGVNLFGLVNGVRSFLPAMIGQGFGHIVSTASNASLVSTSGVAAYVSSKKANLGYCEALQHDLWQAGLPIDVSVICPGKIMSEMPDSARSRPASLAGRVPTEEQVRAMKAFLADGGKSPDEVAAIALDGIAERRFHILTHAETDAPAVVAWAKSAAEGRLEPLSVIPPVSDQ